MPTVRTLYFQRLRWQRGALTILRTYGITKTTAPYFVRQFSSTSASFFPFFVTVVALAIFQTGRFSWS